MLHLHFRLGNALPLFVDGRVFFLMGEGAECQLNKKCCISFIKKYKPTIASESDLDGLIHIICFYKSD